MVVTCWEWQNGHVAVVFLAVSLSVMIPLSSSRVDSKCSSRDPRSRLATTSIPVFGDGSFAAYGIQRTDQTSRVLFKRALCRRGHSDASPAALIVLSDEQDRRPEHETGADDHSDGDSARCHPSVVFYASRDPGDPTMLCGASACRMCDACAGSISGHAS